MRQIKIAIVLASLVLAGCGGWNDLFGSKSSAAIDPPSCSRSPIEVIIARAGMACSATNPCPSGSYCNTGSVCAWACYADSECATGQVCGCDGRCIGESMGGTDGGAPTSDLSCSKDSLLLYKIKPGFSPVPIPNESCDAQGHCPAGAHCEGTICNWIRACDNDERCPAGSFCDPATGTCSWDCHPNVACPSPNQVCNCSGRCVIPGTSPGAGDPTCQTRQALTMSVSPRTSVIEGLPTAPPSWTRTIKVTLSAPTAALLTGTPPSTTTLVAGAQTYLVPGPNAQVLCNGNWFSFPCQLTRAIVSTPGTGGWFVETIGQAPDPVTTRATMLVQVRAAANVVAPGWHAEIFTPGAQNSPQALDFAFNTAAQDISPGTPAPTWQTAPLPDGMTYRGTLAIQGAADFYASQGLPSTISIFGKTVGGELQLFDPTRTISASGTVVLNNGPSVAYYLVKLVDPRVTMQVHANPFSIIQVGPGGALKGEFAIGAVSGTAVFSGFFSLAPVPAGETIPTIPSEPAAQFEPNFDSNPLWRDSYRPGAVLQAANRVGSLWYKDLYSYDTGVSSPIHLSKPAPIGADFEFLEYPPNAGIEECTASFMNGYIAELKKPWTIDGQTYQNNVNVPTPVELVNFCKISTAAYNVYSTQQRRDTMIPCIDGTGIETLMRDQAGFNLSANCAAFRNNQLYSGYPVTKSYAAWLAEDCVRIIGPGTLDLNMIVTLHNVATPNQTLQTFQTPLYICPLFKNSLVRVPSVYSPASAILTDASPGEAAYCYDPAHSGSTVLWSGNLTDGADPGNTMEFSGDLLCRGPDGATYAPKMFPLLDHADRVARGELFAASTSSELLDACLRELRAPAPTFKQADLTPAAVSGTLSNLFSNPAACISMPRFGMGMFHYFSVANSHTTRDRALLGHLLKQWITVHSFISYQGLEESKLRRVLASASDATTKSPVATNDSDPGSLPPIHFDEMLDLVNQSWETVFSAYVRNTVDLSQGSVSPDYRAWSGSVSINPLNNAHQDQWLPLPVIILEGLNQELRLLRAYLEEAALTTYAQDRTAPNQARDQVLARYGTTIRMVYLMEGTASALFNGIYPPLEVFNRYGIAIRELQGLREDVRRKAAELSLGRNPLGIDEDDLPIFFGDPQGTNSQYFASSDYLVGQWAVPAVAAASASITAARDAWLQARNSRIQDRMTATQRDQRVDDLKASQGQKVIENCGLTGIDSSDVLDAFEGGTTTGTHLDLATCFVDPICIARANLTPADVENRVPPQAVQFRLCMLRETAGYRNLQEPYVTCANTGMLVNGCDKVGLYNDFNSGLVPADATQRAELVCQARLGYRWPLPSAQDLAGAMDPSCFHGKLGAAALQIISARQDSEIALQNWNLAQQSYEMDSQYCQQVEVAETDAQMRANILEDALLECNSAKFNAEFELSQMEAATGWISGICSGISTFGGSVVQGAAGLFSVDKKQRIILAEESMEMYRNDYNNAMAIKQANDTIRACWHNVEKSQLAIVAAFAQISRRATDGVTAANQFETLMNENVQALRQGTNDVKREQNRFVSTVAHHYWTSEKIDRFNKDFAWAKRMTYLAMRAVEYEFQQSLPLRQAVLTASHPDQLQDALRTLQQEVGTRTINRRRPSEASIVLSLRDELLALPDHTGDVAGERKLTATRGLQQRLTDPRFAVHDKNGNWLGQGIPFNLGPEGALNYRCGERLWRITATVQGDGLSETQPGVSLLVLKRNTFASQWCEGQGDGSKFQYGSVQPSRRLFGEHGTGALESQANGFSTALLYPWFNIRRTDFYKDSYRDGASEELAGRGLYGDYTLLFPRDVLEGTANDTNACVASQRRFPLEQVEDVLIRFDYLSVDNLPDLQQ